MLIRSLLGRLAPELAAEGEMLVRYSGALANAFVSAVFWISK